MTQDLLVRRAAFEWLAQQVDVHGEVLDWKVLARGFDFEGRRVPLLSQQGIFKPALCELPLSIRTSVKSPYDDHFQGDRLAYAYRGTDRNHRDNVGLRTLMQRKIPLVYFHAVHEGRYLTVSPVFVVADDPAALRFWVQAEAASIELGGAMLSSSLGDASISNDSARREYATRLVRQRLHQQGFRERVLAAYRTQCSMCHLRHRDLLDAAHIRPDSAGGEPVVSNGLALCKIHHAAFDIGVVGVRPDDLTIRVRKDILKEVDGPMLQHGLKAMDGNRLILPAKHEWHPATEHLEWKWQRFERAS